jgi:ATP-dependent DNA helicase RecG
MLTGSMIGAAKRAALEAVAAGEVDVAVGTHALIQESVAFKKLGLTVVDEQHRFGVMQRAALRERGTNGGPASTPHLLVMSATPIPRTLALTFFGDLDVSVIDELPPGRLPVATRWSRPTRREACRFVREEVRRGRQAFVVCPLIEESQSLQTKAATQEYETLSRRIPTCGWRCLHGRISSPEKDRILSDFRRQVRYPGRDHRYRGRHDIPNATVMLVEGADRFDWRSCTARGRARRGAEKSHCLLLAEEPSDNARERLQVLEQTNDGFELAEADLRTPRPRRLLRHPLERAA